MDEKIQEVLDILGEQFSKLQIQDALKSTGQDVDDAVEYLLQEKSTQPVELFTEEIIATDKKSHSQNPKTLMQNHNQNKPSQNINSEYFNTAMNNSNINLLGKRSTKSKDLIKSEQNLRQSGNIYSALGLLQNSESDQQNQNIQRQIEDAMMIFKYSTPVEYEISLREYREKKRKGVL